MKDEIKDLPNDDSKSPSEALLWLTSFPEMMCHDPDPFARAVFQLLRAMRERTTEGVEFLDVCPEDDPVRLNWSKDASPEYMLLYLEHAGDFPDDALRQMMWDLSDGATGTDDLHHRMGQLKQHILEQVPTPPTIAEAIRYVRTKEGW